jgi:hypothetical protein
VERHDAADPCADDQEIEGNRQRPIGGIHSTLSGREDCES